MMNQLAPSLRLVPPEIFASVMEEHWRNDLGNVPSADLRALWESIAATFNDAIKATHREEAMRWRVLQPPTGTGKTQGTCLYAALQAGLNRHLETPVGILIVTRTILQADEIVATTNTLSKAGAVAIAKHSDNGTTVDEAMAHDVLVITHQAYVNAVSNEGDRFMDLINWHGGQRLLTVIDEGLANAVEHNAVTADQIGRILGYIDTKTRAAFPDQVELIEALHDLMLKVDALQENPNNHSQRLIWRGIEQGRIEFPEEFRMAPLRHAMRSIPYDERILNKNIPEDRRRIANEVDLVLRDAEAVMSRWAYFARKGEDVVFLSSRFLVPREGIPGPVVLDATASEDFLYNLLGDNAIIVPVETTPRRYGNVSLHVAKVADGLGKRVMTEKAKHRFPRILDDVLKKLGDEAPSRSVLMICHKKVEHVAVALENPFARFEVAHWGALDGRNDWNDFDTIVIAGLSYRDNIYANNLIFALDGLPKDSAWFEAPSWKEHENVRETIETRQLSAAIIQAVNRVRCRKVIDEKGNCQPTDIFILLPTGRRGTDLLQSIHRAMPGLREVPWSFQLDGLKAPTIRRGSSAEGLIAFMKNAAPGEYPLGKLREELSVSGKVVQKWQEAFRDHGHPITKELSEMGVVYRVKGVGRGARSLLVKMV